MTRNWAAHELLETTELLRKLTADIELHSMCAEMTTDSQLRSILHRHIQGMDTTFHQAVNLLQNKGHNVTATNVYRIHSELHRHIGMEQPHRLRWTLKSRHGF
jgi:copper homeostasis protein CutC